MMHSYPYCHSHVEINSEALISNVRFLHKNLKSGTGTIAVIKADAYGHGAVAVARLLESFYDVFAVASVSEASELREAGITHPILVFGVPLRQTAAEYTRNNLIAVVSSTRHFALLEPGTIYHVKMDTGMGRLGILPQELEKIDRLIRSHRRIYCEGIMTHFSTADEPGSSHFEHQKQVLQSVSDFFRGKYPVHAANSSASLLHPDTHWDLVRHGVGLYGYDPDPDLSRHLQPVMKWKSWIAQCKYVPKGYSLSYGATWQTPAGGYFGVVPTGYADGYPRSLSGKGVVYIDEQPFQQAGTVTMDYIMVWLGHESKSEGTEVLVMGGEKNHAGMWAQITGTIPHEICCGLHPKIPRKVTPRL